MNQNNFQNNYYSIAEQKSKLLTTITLQDLSMDPDETPVFERRDLSSSNISDVNSELEDDNNTIEGQSEESFKLHMSPYKDRAM